MSRNALHGHDCQTARYAGLAGLKNGELLRAAEAAGFEVLVTVDQGIEYQQNLQARDLTIIILRSASNRLNDLLPLASLCLDCLNLPQPGNVIRIDPPKP